MNVPTITEQVSDRQAQRAKLRRFLEAHPFVIYSQETLAEAAGCAVSTVRSRISELVSKDKVSLRWHQSGFLGADGQKHIACKRWEYVPRPEAPLGRDAGDRIDQPGLFS